MVNNVCVVFLVIRIIIENLYWGKFFYLKNCLLIIYFMIGVWFSFRNIVFFEDMDYFYIRGVFNENGRC